MSKTLLLTIFSIFIFMLFSCGNPTTTEKILETGTVTDIDGNTYETVKIGNQWWTAENLRTTQYNDGTAIPHLTDSAAWVNDTSGAYCYYNNTTDSDSIAKFGALYNWYVIETGKLAPEGWHVATGCEWNDLEKYLIANGYNWDGTTSGNKIAKSMAAKTDWYTAYEAGDIGNDMSSNNSSGFSALPGGSRRIKDSFTYIGSNGYWWCDSENIIPIPWIYSLSFGNDYLDNGPCVREYGMSVRLLRD